MRAPSSRPVLKQRAIAMGFIAPVALSQMTLISRWSLSAAVAPIVPFKPKTSIQTSFGRATIYPDKIWTQWCTFSVILVSKFLFFLRIPCQKNNGVSSQTCAVAQGRSWEFHTQDTLRALHGYISEWKTWGSNSFVSMFSMFLCWDTMLHLEASMYCDDAHIWQIVRRTRRIRLNGPAKEGEAIESTKSCYNTKPHNTNSSVRPMSCTLYQETD